MKMNRGLGDNLFLEKIFRRFAVVCSMLWDTILNYLPFLLIGILAASKILGKKGDWFAWVGLTLLFGVALYLVLYILKKATLISKENGSFIWVLFYALYIAIPCVLPISLAFDSIAHICLSLTKSFQDAVIWFIRAILAKQ